MAYENYAIFLGVYVFFAVLNFFKPKSNAKNISGDEVSSILEQIKQEKYAK